MNTRNNILKESFLLFADKGLFDVSVNEIIAKAGVTKGGFYHYFKSKNELIDDVVNCYICPLMEFPFNKINESFCNKKDFLNAKEKLFLFYTEIPEKYIKEEINGDFIEIDGKCFQFLVYEGMKKYKCIGEMRQKIYENFSRLLEKLIDQGKYEGIVSVSVNSKEWAEILNVLKDGIISFSLISQSIDIRKKCLITFEKVWEEIQETDIKGAETING